MDKNYFLDIGRRVALVLIDAMKAPPEGHPFYGNQHLNFGGGASGGNAPRTVAEGERAQSSSGETGRHEGLTGQYAVSHSALSSLNDSDTVFAGSGTMKDYKNSVEKSADGVLDRVAAGKDKYSAAAAKDPIGFELSVEKGFDQSMEKNYPGYAKVQFAKGGNPSNGIYVVDKSALSDVKRIVIYQAKVIVGLK